MSRTETWFEDRLVAVTVNNGDGTGTRTTYNSDGTVASTEQLTGLLILPEPEQPVDDDRFIVAERARREAIDAYMVGKTNSAANVLAANRAGSDAYLAAYLAALET